MNSESGVRLALHVGDHVGLRGTRIVGDVAHVSERDDQPRLIVKVTEVLGKKSTSKTARAWRGAWITCAPAMLVTIPPSSN